MQLRPTAGLVSGLAVLALITAPAAAAGPTVTVRVEGQRTTLLERTRVTLPDTPPPVDGCKRYTPAAAIEVATAGNWDRQEFTQTIIGETHKFDDSDYWAQWLDRGDGYKRGGGICTDVLEEGDEVLMLVDRSPAPSFSPTVFPLDLEGVPGTARRGDQVSVTVVEYRSATGATGEGTRTPVAGATVSGASGPATGPDGRTTVTLDRSGPVTLKASKAGDAPSAGELVEVLEPGAPAPAPTAPAARDAAAPVARIAGIREQQRFSRAEAPRILRGAVTEDASGLAAVKLSLTRDRGGRCRYYSPTRERFRGTRCGAHPRFGIGTASEFSYLLPERLGPGRYVLEAIAVDRAGNRDRPARGRNRVVFHVR